MERLQLEQIDVTLVEAFLDYLEKERRCAPSTRNHRLSALHAFFRYVQSEEPDRMLECQRVLAIPLRRQTRNIVGYLSKENLAKILAVPDLKDRAGRRDAVLLSVLYDTGARVQELIDLSVIDVRLADAKTTQIYAKANIEMTRKALEKTSGSSPIPKIPSWQNDKNMLEWLRSL